MPGATERLHVAHPPEHRPAAHGFLVIDRAVQSDQGRKSVYVVDDVRKVDGVLVGTVEKRKVTTGRCRSTVSGSSRRDWRRTTGLTGTLQQVREGIKVQIDPRPMSSFGPQETSKEPPKKDDKSKKTPR